MALYFQATIEEIKQAKDIVLSNTRAIAREMKKEVRAAAAAEQDEATKAEYREFMGEMEVDGEEEVDTAFTKKGYEGAKVFVQTFIEKAQDLVPVDTGRLLRSIDASIIMDGCEPTITCIADTEYAEYVEFGTYKQRAQPYFIPALMAAFEAAIPIWEAEDEIEEVMNEILEPIVVEAPGILWIILIILLMIIISMILITIFTAIEQAFKMYKDESYVSRLVSII